MRAVGDGLVTAHEEYVLIAGVPDLVRIVEDVPEQLAFLLSFGRDTGIIDRMGEDVVVDTVEEAEAAHPFDDGLGDGVIRQSPGMLTLFEELVSSPVFEDAGGVLHRCKKHVFVV